MHCVSNAQWIVLLSFQNPLSKSYTVNLNPTRIAIADDHQIVLDGLKALIREYADFELIADANNGQEMVKLVNTLKLDLVLMDIDMPIMNGIQATQEIKKTHPDIKILILSMHNEKGVIQKVMEAGADGYILKNSDHKELLDAVRKVASGQKYFSSDVTMTLLNPSNGQSSEDNKVLSELTEREIEILKLIAEGFSNKEIGDKLFISHRTVDTHRTNLMKKLDVHNIAGIIKFAIKNKLV